MKKLLLFVSSLFIAASGFAQSFVPDSGTSDTVRTAYVSGTSVTVINNITSTNVSNPVRLRWKILYKSLDAGWDPANSGICDNHTCYYDLNSLTFAIKDSDPYLNTTSTKVLDVPFSCVSNPTPGSKAVVTLQLTDTTTGYSRNLTFIGYRAALGVGQVNIDNGVTLYPNPAHDFVNVVFDKELDVRTIAIFNLIGKTMRVFKATDNNSAKLDLDNIPSGVYFVRMMNGQGQVVATRRFTRQ